MRHKIIVLMISLIAVVASADEVLPTLKVGNVVYTNITVTSVTAKNVYFNYNGGMGNAKLKDLDPLLQKHFHYDGSKDMAEAKEAAAAAAALKSVGPDNKVPATTDPKILINAAIARVKAIINQPVTTIPLNSINGDVFTFDNWFHDGATKPDFDTVDIRKTQDTSIYSKYDYISSKLTPGIAFPGKAVEFNSMTKYFYADRSLPKKKLTEAEMLEVNRMYRIIGQCEKRLKK